MPILHIRGVPSELMRQIRDAAHAAGIGLEQWVIDTLHFRLDMHASNARAGLQGGRARAASLSPEQRSAVARRAAESRWGPRRESSE